MEADNYIGLKTSPFILLNSHHKLKQQHSNDRRMPSKVAKHQSIHEKIFANGLYDTRIPA